MRYQNLIRTCAAGNRYGRWVVLGDAPRLAHCPHVRRLRVRCDCGVEKVVSQTHLRSRISRSCGCLRRELAAERLRALAPRAVNVNCGKPEYGIWVQIRHRCQKPWATGWRLYGGRGIRVCERWDASFEAFFADMGRRPTPRHSIDRINVNGHYEPGNCRWATQREQNRNTRRNIWIEVDGQRKIATDWSRISGVRVTTITERLKRGWDAKRAVFGPVQQKNYRDSDFQVSK